MSARAVRTALAGTAAVAGLLCAQPALAQAPASLTPQDYIAIQQLVSKYAYAIDECTNRGYDYADLYTADGAFYTSRGGKVLGRFEGRERLAEAARGGMPDCKDVPWAGIVHMLVNHVIEPAPGGATGKVYLDRGRARRRAGQGGGAGPLRRRLREDAAGLALQDAHARAGGEPAGGVARVTPRPAKGGAMRHCA